MEEEILPERILLEVDGKDQWVPAYTVTNAAKKIGKSYQGLLIILKNLRKSGVRVKLYTIRMGRGKFILKEDLDNLRRATPIPDEDDIDDVDED